ncbi:MAG: hypothetical protein ACJ75I_06450 [Solirubrobacterales bacterium]
MTLREAPRICIRREHQRRTIRIGLVVGTILTLINQLDVFINGDATALTWIKTGLIFCVLSSFRTSACLLESAPKPSPLTG